MTIFADLILAVHFLFVLFVAGGLVAVWIGAARGWHWVRNRRFRLLHIAAVGFVAFESIVGMVCPLTVWEDALRGGGPGASFVARWVGRLLYWQLPEAVFTAVYVAVALATIVTYFRVPPQSSSSTPGPFSPGRK